MTEEQIRKEVTEVLRRTNARCNELLKRWGMLTQGDALQILYEELGLHNSRLAPTTYGYSWDIEPVKLNDDGSINWRFEP